MPIKFFAGPILAIYHLPWKKGAAGRRRAAAGATARLAAALLAVVLTAAAGGAPGASDDPRADLQRLRGKIEELEQRLGRQQGEKSRVLTQLADLERQSGRLARNIEGIRSALAGTRVKLKSLEQQVADQRALLDKHRRALAGGLLSVYRMGQHAGWKLLLNQQDPSDLGRMVQYAGYLNRARTRALALARDALAQLDLLAAELASTQAELEAERSQLAAEQARLAALRQRRGEVLDELERALRRGGHRLSGLREQERTLQDLVDSIGQLLDDVPDAPYERQPFSSLAGRLPWPTRGQIKARYNSRTGQGSLRSKGLLIAAPEGQPVSAIYYGHVIYAGWLQGLGHLAIVDHGEEYLSLYAHNQSLLKETGDWVEAGETIATVGDSGGQTTAGLYFEIRRGGKPVDPARWIGRRYRAPVN